MLTCQLKRLSNNGWYMPPTHTFSNVMYLILFFEGFSILGNQRSSSCFQFYHNGVLLCHILDS